MDRNLPFQSLTELAAMLAQGEATSRAIVDACLDAIDAQDGKLHAFIKVYHDEARSAADAADAARRKSRSTGPLTGLPVALKDLLELDGHQTTAGSRSWLGRRSNHTATAVTKLITAGMIPIGKTHLVEFAFGGWGRNAPMGAPWNPWDPATHRVAGGSSSGSAVAVASGEVPAAIGSDTGGSVRIPAGLTGLTGLKTTPGLISLYGAIPLSFTLDTIGPLARSADDAALLAQAMAGPDPQDPATLLAPVVDFDAALRSPLTLTGTRVAALASEHFPADTDPAVVAAFDAAIAVLRERGATVEITRIPFDFDQLAGRIGQIIAAEAYAYHRAAVDDTSVRLDPWVRRRLEGGRAVSAADYLALLAERKRVAAAFAAWMHGRDVLLTPGLPIAAIALDAVDEATAPLAYFTRPVNYFGGCGLALPAGSNREGMPVGVQLVGVPFADADLIRIGRAFQSVTDYHRRRPPAH